MKKVQANLDICRQIAEGNTVQGQELTDELVFIFPIPGVYGYIFSKEEIAFALDKVKMIPKGKKAIVDLSAVDPKNELNLTKSLRILDNEKSVSRKFTAEDGRDVWLNTQYFRNIVLRKCRFYQDSKKPVGPIIVVEKEVPVMCLMPIRQYEDELYN